MLAGSLMEVEAFVLIETQGENAKRVVNKLKELEGVKSIAAVSRPNLVIAVAELDDLNALGVLVYW
jgi:hypothetical protein